MSETKHRACAEKRVGGAGVGVRRALLAALAGCLGLGAMGCSNAGDARADSRKTEATLKRADQWVIASEPGTKRPPFQFSKEDDQFLDEVQRASFWFLWHGCDEQTGMVYDRSSVKFASVAGVGFQLAALPAGVERGWITREQGFDRARRILAALENEPTNRRHGMFFHFLDGRTAKPIDMDVVSTIDSALLIAGMLAAGPYFGGEVRERADRMVSAVDWTKFVLDHPQPNEQYLKGYVSLGWKPADPKNPVGDGELLKYAWADSGDEHRLIYFLAALAPRPEHRLDASMYYRTRRALGEHADSGPHVWFPWSGALFASFFAHCFVDYAARGADNPLAMGVERRPQVDWWENSRRQVTLHRRKAMENPRGFKGLGENGWGLTASDASHGYAVPGVFPTRIRTLDEVPQVDYAVFEPKDDFGDGTVAPYGAGCAIMFQPDAAIAALRHYRNLMNASGQPLVWRDPGRAGETGEFGFRDAFNLDTGWVAKDYVAIDQGPLVLAIENARTGLIWRLMNAHPWVAAGKGRLGWVGKKVGGGG